MLGKKLQLKYYILVFSCFSNAGKKIVAVFQVLSGVSNKRTKTIMPVDIVNDKIYAFNWSDIFAECKQKENEY